MKRRSVLTILGIILMVSGIAVALLLVKQQQILNNNAASATTGLPNCSSLPNSTSLKCVPNSTSGATRCALGGKAWYCCPLGFDAVNNFCYPSCGSLGKGLSCKGNIPGAIKCAAGGSLTGCCPSGKVATNGVCCSPGQQGVGGSACYSPCGSGLGQCTPNINIQGAIRCASGGSLVSCCPSGQSISNGTCYPSCATLGTGRKCGGSSVSGATKCVSGGLLAGCCPPGKTIFNNKCV